MHKTLILTLVILIGAWIGISRSVDAAPRKYRPNTLLVRTGQSSGLRIQSNGFDIQSDPAFGSYQPLLPTRGQIQTRSLQEAGLYIVTLRDGADLDALSQSWQYQTFNGMQILNVQPDYEYTIDATNNDPYTNHPSANNFISLATVNRAWDLTTGLPSITIAVIDTGVQQTHEDLINQIWINPGEIPNNNFDDDKNGYIDDVYGYNFGDTNTNVTDLNGHGTHVAGIIGAQSNNGIGIAGVCPNCKIMALKANVGSSKSFFTALIVKAIQYAIDNGAHIINLSLSGDGYDTEFRTAVQTAGLANITVVAAAGNEQDNMDTVYKLPGSFPEAIAVSATNQKVFDSRYSNYGSAVFVSAPGTGIYSTYRSSTNNQTYEIDTGTSMAAPVVSGAIGLLKSLNPNLTTQNIRAIIQSYSDDLGPTGKDPFYGYGFINARAWLDAIADTDPPIIGLVSTSSVYDGTTPYTITFPVTDSGIITPNVTMTIETHSDTRVLNVETLNGITEMRPTYTVTVTSVYPEAAELFYRIRAVDGVNNTTLTPTLSIRIMDESGPVISTVNSFRDDLVSKRLKLSVRDRSAIATEQISVIYNNQTVTLTGNSGLFNLSGALLTINLDAVGFIPTQSLLIQIVVPDVKANITTRSIMIGSVAPPTITPTLISSDRVDTKSPIRFTVSDEDGITLNGFAAIIRSGNQQQLLTYATSPNSFLIDGARLGVFIPTDWGANSSTANVEITVFDRLGTQATANQTVTFGTQFSVQGTDRTQVLVYPNPLNPKQDQPVAAYNLTQSASDGRLMIYDLRLKRLASYEIPSGYRYAGYNEFPFLPVDDTGAGLPNGTYIAVLILTDGKTTHRFKQKFAVINR